MDMEVKSFEENGNSDDEGSSCKEQKCTENTLHIFISATICGDGLAYRKDSQSRLL